MQDHLERLFMLPVLSSTRGVRSAAPKNANRHTALPAQLQETKPRAVTCNASLRDAADSDSEGGNSLDRPHATHSQHVLPELEHWSDDEGLLPVRHPGAFPYAGTSLQILLGFRPVALSALCTSVWLLLPTEGMVSVSSYSAECHSLFACYNSC